MPQIEVLKFGSSVLRSSGCLHLAVDEIYRRWCSGYWVLAVVSAFQGVTNRLIEECSAVLGVDCPEATAAYVATGELHTAALLDGSLRRYGLPSRMIEPREIGLLASGTSLESTPTGINRAVLERLWLEFPILVLPGFYGVDDAGRTALFGRGGSDLSALFLAAELGAGCRLLKDVTGVFDWDPARSAGAHRFRALSWETAIGVSGPLIQPKALRFAQRRALPFEVGRPNEGDGTHVGAIADSWALPTPTSRPLRVVLMGCGTVGRGVYESMKRYSQRFDIRYVVVRDTARYPQIDRLTEDQSVAAQPDVDAVIVCYGGVANAYSAIMSALTAGKFVVTANKSTVAAHGASLAPFADGPHRRLWYSAAVGGALPALEILATLDSPVREIRGIINGTCGVVLDAWAEGRSRQEAVALAQARGFAEADPTRDLNGTDSAEKLALLIAAAFGEWVDPAAIATRGIDSITQDPRGFKLIARAQRSRPGFLASVAPERPLPDSFLGCAQGPENRLEIELTNGEVIRLRAQGAGRWPTTISVMGDLLQVARIHEKAGGQSSLVDDDLSVGDQLHRRRAL
jgi:homoserine dehydrogenase